MARHAKGMTIEQCVEKASRYISMKGECLLLFDVIGSRKYDTSETRNSLQQKIFAMAKDINSRFDRYFPSSNINCLIRYEKGFEMILGDGSWAAINDASIIPEIVEYQKAHYADIPLYWGIAIDGSDEEGLKLVK